MRIPGLRRDRDDEAYQQLPSQIICPVCGLRNDSMARFCRNCGLPLGAPRDPVRGTTSRRADLPSEHGAGIAAIVGLLAAVVVLAGAGFLILRTNSGTSTGSLPTATPVAMPSTVAGGTPDAGASLMPAATSGALPTRKPLGSGEPATSDDPGVRTPAPSAAPSEKPTVETSAAPLVADTGFTCEAADFDDPSRGAWRVGEASWGARDKWDELTIELVRVEGKGRSTIGVEAMSARDAAQVSGLDEAPTDRVILITFDGDVSPRREPSVNLLGLKALDYLNLDAANDTPYAVVGVNRDGCYRLFAPAWKKGQEVAVGERVKLLLDVKYR